jgi:hypothetical protein
MGRPVKSTRTFSARAARLRVVAVPLTLFALAATLGLDPWHFASPVAPATAVPAWATDPATVRHPELKPEIELAGFTYRCSDCHGLFSSPPETTRPLTQHRDIKLKHGINTRCFNCHHRTNRDALVDDWGREIPMDQPQLVCAKCHGPVYRDWLHGSHGRTNGYWDTRAGPQVRVTCVRCHDPHQPPFPPMHPAPGPHTLRMGDQSFPAEPETVANPLRIYRHLTNEDGAENGAPAEPLSPRSAGEGR